MVLTVFILEDSSTANFGRYRVGLFVPFVLRNNIWNAVDFLKSELYYFLNSPDSKIGTRVTYCESLDAFLCAKVEI